MPKTVATLRQLFEVLCRVQRNTWFSRRQGSEASAPAYEAYEMLIGSYSPIEEKELNGLFPDSELIEADFPGRSKVLYLPRLEKDSEFVPVLSLSWKSDETGERMALRVMLVSRGGNGGKLRGIGFRLESPHEGEEDEENDGGRHGFYHAQFIRALGWGPLVECPSWLPETQPSFPLTADDPVTLVLCLLLSLYGKKYCWTFYTEHQIFDLKSHLDRLDRWIKWPST